MGLNWAPVTDYGGHVVALISGPLPTSHQPVCERPHWSGLTCVRSGDQVRALSLGLGQELLRHPRAAARGKEPRTLFYEMTELLDQTDPEAVYSECFTFLG